jgi:hypothetical protein
MSALLRGAIALVAAYVLVWTIASSFIIYSAVKRLDFTEYIHWFIFAWTFNGLEMVALTWLFSLAAFIPLASLRLSDEKIGTLAICGSLRRAAVILSPIPGSVSGDPSSPGF